MFEAVTLSGRLLSKITGQQLVGAVLSRVLGWESPCWGHTEQVGVGRQERLCPAGGSVQLQLLLSPFEQPWHLPLPLPASVPGTDDIPTRLRWEYKHLLPHFPSPGEDIPISSWPGPCFPSFHHTLSRSFTSPPRTLLGAPAESTQCLTLLPFKTPVRNFLPYCRQIFKFLDYLLSLEFLCDVSLLSLISTIFS